MSACVPVRDMRDTAGFAELVEREGDVTVTKNGYATMHCLSESAYRLMMDEVAKSRLLSRIALAEEEVSRGLGSDLDDMVENLRAEHGL